MSDTTRVFFTSLDGTQPVFHRKSKWSWYRDRTECSMLIRDLTSLQMRHARKIGRPCKFCWPDATERPRPTVPTTHGIWRTLDV